MEEIETEDGVQGGEEFAEPGDAPAGDSEEAGDDVTTDSDVIEGESTRIDVNITETETDLDLTAGAVEGKLLN